MATHFDAVEQEVAAAIHVQHLLELDADIAISLAKVVGGRFDESVVLQYAEVLRTDPERRILLLPLGIGTGRKNRLRASIAGMLPLRSPALGVFKQPRGDIPTGCLAELYGHEEVLAVTCALAKWFRKDEVALATA